MLQLLYGLLKVSLSVLGLKLLSHGEGHGGLVKGLICSDGHFNFVSNSKKEETSLWLGKSNLSDDLVEAL